ncbi:hypothetical protein PHYSODRAFT_301641 [Phytophthora sojae]|uniref:Uncharacterized protein n=1 Tax=Phytophthora sojae (strain P6497) TaxID=1094619 RepID=G4ZK29_PHYSP|nr:hypothetical protein PHYSODRAFT_301641 [Phytophthora sojae]EGZ14833.1 hypothetical protein PHYSODRAFT_301641 [Phytophthora sojae]|eukprot:XP_009528582.1 hypothetical protein PHYSODRAFT_301641 [Phytophthora sojae]
MATDAIAVTMFTEFISEARILDEQSEYCSLPDLENVFVAANLELTQEAKEKGNPDRSLMRFGFLECVIRIANTFKLHKLYDAHMGKYCKPGEKQGMHLVEFLALFWWFWTRLPPWATKTISRRFHGDHSTQESATGTEEDSEPEDAGDKFDTGGIGETSQAGETVAVADNLR